MSRRTALVACLAAMILASCGKKGPLLPPLERIPKAVEDLELRQRGEQVLLTWTNPTTYVDGNPLTGVSEVEIWLAQGDEPPELAPRGLFPERARLLARIPAGRLSLFLERGRSKGTHDFAYVPERNEGRARFDILSLRVKDLRGKTSTFSPPRAIEVRIAPEPPCEVRATVLPDSIELRWEPPREPEILSAAGAYVYDVYRREGDGPPVLLNESPLEGREYRDMAVLFGRTYQYTIRAVVPGLIPLVESEDSAAVVVEARDIFPPAAPTGLTAVGGEGVIALTWDIGPETDLAGFRLWRKEEPGGEFVLIKELAAGENAFSDVGVEKNRRYVYAISAFDAAGNESPRSAPVGGAVRDKPA